MSEMVTLVKLDGAGHVVGHMRAPRPHGAWIVVPAEVGADPMAYRLCSTWGWVRKTAEEHAECEERHALRPVERDDQDELLDLLDHLDDGTISQKQRDRVLYLVALRVLRH